MVIKRVNTQTRTQPSHLSVVPEIVEALDPALANLSAASPGRDLSELRLELLKPNTVIDRFKIKRFIGRGGMGEVYLAEQLTPLVRDVAFKRIAHPNLNVRERMFFELESQTLARMQHPCVAQIFELGETDGSPWLVMEYVNGLRIDDFCDQEKLSLLPRLYLFLDVLKGVQHAHQKGVIHRDLKPANILVSRVDGRPQPKLIDFGIAIRDLNQKERAFAGTPEYMSPEQAGAFVAARAIDAHAPVDTRSDVYSLGIVLYRLLTGALPYKLEASSLPSDNTINRSQLRRADDVLKELSADQLAQRAQNMQMRPAALKAALSGDLSWIMWKATRFSRDDRYDSVGAFAADIRYFLNDAPVQAAPVSRWRNLRRIVRKRLSWVLTAILAMLVSLLTVFWMRNEIAQLAAERDAALAANQLKHQVLAPTSAASADVALWIHEARLRQSMAEAAIELNEFTDAKKQLRNACTLFAKAFGDRDRQSLKCWSLLALSQHKTGESMQGKALIEKIYAQALADFGPKDELSRSIDELRVQIPNPIE
jgi:eukaryotic-like serine/threonine-protein kinase